MSRSESERLQDILDAIGKIRRYHEALAGAEFDEQSRDGIYFNLVVIGEAANALPAKLTELEPEIDWRNIVGLRNFLAHKYFDIDAEVIATIIRDELAPLEQAVERIRSSP